MFANFYKGDRCLYSVDVESVKEAERLADRIVSDHPDDPDDWTLTNEPMGRLYCTNLPYERSF